MLKVGDVAPDFTLPAHTEETITLSKYRGRSNVVLAFFPLAWTPVCSDQIPSYQAVKDRFASLNTQILGISIDSVYSHQAWAETLGGIKYPLLSDFWPHGAVASKYGVMTEDGFTERALFVIDRQGIIRYIDHHDIDETPDNEVLFKVLADLK
jgi:peroxiredoxin